MLVEIYGAEGNEQLVTTSLMVAEKFGKEHKHVLDSIREILKAEKSALTLFKEDTYKVDGNNKSYPMFYMNRDGFSLLVMGFNGKDALKWKLEYINTFNEMENVLKRILTERAEKERVREIERVKSKQARFILTDAIRDFIKESPNKKFAYPNYTKLVYKALFNKTPKELREEYHITDNHKNVRDYFTAEELEMVIRIEGLISGLLACGWGYMQIKEFVMENANKCLES